MRGAVLGLWGGFAVSCATAGAAEFVDRVEEGRPVLLRCDGERCRQEVAESGALQEGDVLVDGQPSSFARSRAQARIRALRRRLGAKPLDADLSLERAP